MLPLYDVPNHLCRAKLTMPKSIPDGLTRQHVLLALTDLDEGIAHDFGEATGYQLIHDGKTYAPKAVVGVAFRHLTGTVLDHNEFSGGERKGQANFVLRGLGFTVEPIQPATSDAFITSRGHSIPEDWEEFQQSFWFNMWQKRMWPYNEVEAGHTLFWYDSKSQQIVWRSAVRELYKFEYETKQDLRDRLIERFGEDPATDPYYADKAEKGYCIAFKATPIQRLNLPKPSGFRFPQGGWIRGNDDAVKEWLSTVERTDGSFSGEIQSVSSTLTTEGGEHVMSERKSGLMNVFDNAGAEVQAQIEILFEGSDASVVFESRGGSIGAPNERNSEYNKGVELVLARLADLQCRLVDAVVETRQTERLGLSRAQRRLSDVLPISLEGADIQSLRKSLCAAQRPIGRSPDAKGSGNNTKRMRLYVEGLPKSFDEAVHEVTRRSIVSSLDEQIASIARPLRRGHSQGRGLDGESRRAVELRAMEVAEQYLRRDWEEVDDKSGTEPYDFLCRSGDSVLYVEVKGTTGEGSAVIVTRNEVALAREKMPNTLLAVVSGIELDRSTTPPSATGGRMAVVHPWEIHDDDLSALAFEYTVRHPG
jgi:hypothetical protein